MIDEPTDPLEQLYLHVFIASMVLIKDFYDQFGAAYAEPALPETDLSVHFMGFFLRVCEVLAPGLQLAEKMAPHLAKKISEELEAYGQKDIVGVKETLLTTADFYSKQPKQPTSLGDLPVAALVQHICETVMNSTPEYAAYTDERVRNMLEVAVPFKQLVAAVS